MKDHVITQIHADELYGSAFAKMPKAVLAVLAYYLADICSDAGADNGQALDRMIEELRALSGNGLIGKQQADGCIAAIKLSRVESQ